MLTPGQTFAGAYRIEGALGEREGRLLFGAVHLQTGAERRIELLPGGGDPVWQARFLARLRGVPSLPRDLCEAVADFGVAPEGAWAAYDRPDYAEHETLAELLEKRGLLPPEEADPILREIGVALSRAHAVGVPHGDLRPEHVVLGPPVEDGDDGDDGGRRLVVVRGFVIGRLWADETLSRPAVAVIRSTWQWCDPDTITRGPSHPPMPCDDLWPFALIAFRVLAGKVFWRGEAMSDVMKEIVVDSIPPASARAAEIGAPGALPPTFDIWFQRATRRDRNERFADAMTAVSALRAVFHPPPDVPILGNPKGSFYDDGLHGVVADTSSGEQGPYRDQVQRDLKGPEIPILGNPKGSFYDGGLARDPRRWPAIIALVLVIAGAGAAVAAYTVLRR